MTAAFQDTGTPVPATQMIRLHERGFSLLPLGRGEDGKSPLLSFSGAERIPLKRVFGPMHRAQSGCYGVRLDGLAVIDCDEDDPALIEEMERRFGASPVHVRTPRGRHLYYRAGSGTYPNLRGEGLTVDIKRGAASYVMGPKSRRPDGGTYDPAKGELGVDELPAIQLPQTAQQLTRQATPAGQIAEGGRNYALALAAIRAVELVTSQDELFDHVQQLRDAECENPASVPDEEIRKIAEWAWSRRLEGKVFKGRNSEFRINRQALDAIMQAPNASDALALFVVLQSKHGHRPAITFPLDYAAMKSAGYTDLSRDRFLAARKTLQRVGILTVATAHVAGKQPRSYRLNRLLPEALSASNVASIHQEEGGGV